MDDPAVVGKTATVYTIYIHTEQTRLPPVSSPSYTGVQKQIPSKTSIIVKVIIIGCHHERISSIRTWQLQLR
jgi:hypothetical protein